MFMNNTKTMFCILFMASLLLSVNAQNYTETPDVKSRIDLKPDMTVLLYPKGQAAGNIRRSAEEKPGTPLMVRKSPLVRKKTTGFVVLKYVIPRVHVAI